MLYVFHVDSGKMMRFDMSITVESVAVLKEQIELVSKIPSDKQVLLISGGECLDSSKRVCSYSAGTDTNPIFLFSKSIIESLVPPTPITEYSSESDLEQKIREHLDMPNSFNTVAKRAQLAQHLHELAREQQMICEDLVHDQHLQQQGWSAVVANLEDITLEFKKRSEIFEKSFADYMEERESYLKFLTHFNKDLQNLQRIPVLSVLLELERQNNIEISKASEENTNTSQEESESSKEITLYEWISAADSKSTMDQLYDHCSRGLEQFDAQVFKMLKEEIEEMLKSADNPQMKEVKGLGDRLFGLETLMREAKKYVKQQEDLAKSFINNQRTASNTKDSSILPDLCNSHKKQLQMMAQSHQHLIDIRRRCTKAKDELSTNLYHRLRWVMYIEDHILEIDQKLVIYHENLKRLRKHLEVLQQIHLAPATYLCAVAEVVRRRAFSQSFLLWASELACHLLTIHNEEVTRRKEFQLQFEGHFLNSLFPGMEDSPPSFATQAPSVFDSALPKITEEDLERLKAELPDLADNLNLPDSTAITNFFLMKSLVKKDDEKQEEMQEKIVQAVDQLELASGSENLLKIAGAEPCLSSPGLAHVKEHDKGCESETDTEEFEKVGQSPLELNFKENIPQQLPKTQDASTSTEVSERSVIPPKKPPRIFQRISQTCSADDPSQFLQRTMSTSSIQSNTESFTNIKNHSLDSIDEFSSFKSNNDNNCFNSHHYQTQQQQQQQRCNSRSKSLSPHTPQSPKDIPFLGHDDFVNDEYYIDESLPSSLSIDTAQAEFNRHIDTTNNVVAMLQDNLQMSRMENEKLKNFLIKLQHLAQEAMNQLRFEVTELKTNLVILKTSFGKECESLSSSWENLITEKDNKDKEMLESLRKNHEKIIEDLRRDRESKCEEIEKLLSDKTILESDVSKLNQTVEELKQTVKNLEDEYGKKIEELQRNLQEKNSEKEKSIKEAVDRLNREHKAQIENIRTRYKLMTMEKSPSDSSLEKSIDFSSLPSHATLLAQMTENFELDKENAVQEALKLEKEKWEALLREKVQELEEKFELEKQELFRNVATEISEEKDKQIDILIEREKNLNLECLKYKNTIQQLSEIGGGSNDSALLDKINSLEKEKETLEKDLDLIRTEKINEMTVSVAVCEGKVDVMTSPIRQKEIMSRSEITITPAKSGKLSIDSCKTGDLVFVIWDPRHGSFRIAQENKHMFFLHSDCLDGLGLKVVEGQPNKVYCSGEVYDKEYCHARKSENRYKVPKGTRFFRVKVRPAPSPPKSTTNVETMSQSQTAMTISETSSDELTLSRSLPSSPPRTHPVIMENDEIDATKALDQPEIFQAESVERHFAEDSGIVETVEEAREVNDNENCDDDDRVLETRKYGGRHNEASGTWLEMMISRVFTKSVHNATEKNSM